MQFIRTLSKSPLSLLSLLNTSWGGRITEGGRVLDVLQVLGAGEGVNGAREGNRGEVEWGYATQCCVISSIIPFFCHCLTTIAASLRKSEKGTGERERGRERGGGGGREEGREGGKEGGGVT